MLKGSREFTDFLMITLLAHSAVNHGGIANEIEISRPKRPSVRACKYRWTKKKPNCPCRGENANLHDGCSVYRVTYVTAHEYPREPPHESTRVSLPLLLAESGPGFYVRADKITARSHVQIRALSRKKISNHTHVY